MTERNLNVQLNNVAIYCRLSKDDGTLNDSISIQNQKDVLTEYANNNGWHIYDYYIDDGFSGTNFERPSFKRMINDIEHGKIQIVLTKDLSRLGRNYLQTGYYTEEYFPLKEVRYIAVNDNFDTLNEDGNEILPFKNLINEWYAKDISKKIRFTVSNKMKNGEFVKSVVPLYGYDFKDNQRIINPNTAPIVKFIFQEYIKGVSTKQICEELIKRKIYTPSYYNYFKYGYNSNLFINISEEEKYHWKNIMIRKILEKIEYTGALVRGKRETKFKRKGAKFKNQKDWYIFEDRFEAIISKNEFEIVKNMRESKNKNTISNQDVPYKDLICCGYCGKPLRINKRNKILNQDYGLYRFSCRNKHEDGAGSINNKELEFVLIEELKQLREILLKNKNKFLNYAKDFYLEKKRVNIVNIDNIKIDNLKKREKELNNYIQLAFESYARDELPQKIYESMIKKYKEELQVVVKDLNDYKVKSKENDNKKDYFKMAKDIVDFLENVNDNDLLNTNTLHFLIKKISIKSYGERINHRYQNKEVNIEYKNIDELIKDFVNNDK